MTGHLLLVALGPVQEFIAQARRTRDLWFGSHLLSELGRAAARQLVANGARLIFPALDEGDPELAPCDRSTRRAGRRAPLSVANKLLAEVPSGSDPAVLARRTREAVLGYWREIARSVKTDCRGLLDDGIDAAWDEQVGTFVEFTATWAPLQDYRAALAAVDASLAARKNLRDFGPWREQRGSVPKSSLDGARETVLAPRRLRDPALKRRYRIADGEELDAIGVVKRAGGDPEQFVPVVNVALASWIAMAATEARRELDELKGACAAIRLREVRRQDLPCAEHFAYDASVLLRDRWTPVLEEVGSEEDPQHWGHRHVLPLLEVISEPFPYVACLVADGDQVGRAIANLGSADAHRTFSRAVSEFAAVARDVVEQTHLGSLVYAGGDDVLAFLPLPCALACADALRRRFGAAMESACPMLPATQRPTLSVGIGVGHVMEGMGDLLALGREAEHLAKHGCDGEQTRNALAVIVDKRSGGRRSWRARWDAWNGDAVGRIRADAAALEDQLPTRKVYEIGHTVLRCPDPTQASGAGWGKVLALEVRRSLMRVRGSQPVDPAGVGLSLAAENDYRALRAEVAAWVERMLVARTFAEAEPRQRRAAAESTA